MTRNQLIAQILLESVKQLLNEGLSDKELFKKAYKGDISILSDPNVSKVKDEHGFTPLHILADKRKIEILKHPDVNEVKSYMGRTPFDWLCLTLEYKYS